MSCPDAARPLTSRRGLGCASFGHSQPPLPDHSGGQAGSTLSTFSDKLRSTADEVGAQHGKIHMNVQGPIQLIPAHLEELSKDFELNFLARELPVVAGTCSQVGGT